jgi:hypothetical protein
MKKAALISLVVLNCVMFIVNINAQSLTSAPKPSAEIAGLTKALQGEWSLTGAGSFLPRLGATVLSSYCQRSLSGGVLGTTRFCLSRPSAARKFFTIWTFFSVLIEISPFPLHQVRSI